jgi:DNA-binding NarL/FixJ family response regulator
MDKPLPLIIADDYPLFREGIRLLLDQNKFVIAGEASNGEELLQLAATTAPAIVITDIQMPGMDGVTATRLLKERYPGIGVIALTMFGDDNLIIDMLDAGADGYLLKSTSKEELLAAIETVHAGGHYFCNATSKRLTLLIARRGAANREEYPVAALTEKEKEIIQLICEQMPSKQIADKTNLSIRTVEMYRSQIIRKTGSNNVVGIVIYAIRNGLYTM